MAPFRFQSKLNRKEIPPDALRIIKSLQKQGFTTYLVGGCVRDLLLDLHPKDFDISTTAPPYQVRKILPHAYVIGKRFRLVLVKRDSQQFEVSTFRRDASKEELAAQEGEDLKRLKNKERNSSTEKKEAKEAPLDKMRHSKHKKNNFFGSPEEDAKRRDFTINGLFYDPIANKLIDYVEGLKDLRQGVIRMIGNPEERLKEDPIRILRALRLSHKIHFKIEFSLKEAMSKYAFLLKDSVLPRRREELLKILRLEDPSLALLESFDLKILPFLSYHLEKIFLNIEAMENFLYDLTSYHDKYIDPEDPIELFSPLILAYIKSAPLLQKKNSKSSRWLSSKTKKNLLLVMKGELGMFKYEQNIILRALRIQKLLKSFLSLKKKQKYMQFLLKEQSFPLALKMAERSQTLSAEDLYFWKEKWAKSQNQDIFFPLSPLKKKKTR